MAKRILSRRDATVRTPPTMAQVLFEINRSASDSTFRRLEITDEVKKWANDCRVSACTTRIGEISKLKKAPKGYMHQIIGHACEASWGS